MDEQDAGGRPGEGRERLRSLRRWCDLPPPPPRELRRAMWPWIRSQPDPGRRPRVRRWWEGPDVERSAGAGTAPGDTEELARIRRLVEAQVRHERPWERVEIAAIYARERLLPETGRRILKVKWLDARLPEPRRPGAGLVAFDAVVPCMPSEDKSCGQAELAADLDLREDRLAPGPPYVTSSVSWDSSFEVVEFDPEPGVEYRISVYAACGVKKTSYMAVAWETWDVP